MKDKKKVLILGPAYPFRGGIADTQNYLAQNLKLSIQNCFFLEKHNLVMNLPHLELTLKEKFTVSIP
jgi:hypothetical protein